LIVFGRFIVYSGWADAMAMAHRIRISWHAFRDCLDGSLLPRPLPALQSAARDAPCTLFAPLPSLCTLLACAAGWLAGLAVCSGGGSLGTFHLGVVRALLEHHMLPRVLAGSSVGSIGGWVGG
jgi:hypothetical protein